MNNKKLISFNILIPSLLLVTALSLFTQQTLNLYMGAMVALTFLTIGVIIKDSRVLHTLFDNQNRTFIFWFTFFFVFIAVHYSYVNWDSFSFMRRMRIWLPPLLMFVWLARIKDEYLLDSFAKSCAIATIPIIIIILSSNGITAVYEGERFSGEDFNMNGNTIALYLLFLSFFLLVLFRKKGYWQAFIPYILVGLAFVIFITGCRRAIIGLVLLYVCYFWIFGKRHRLRNFVFAIGIVYAVSVVLMNVDFLYDVAGSRMAKFFYNLGLMEAHGAETYDYSSEIRGEMVPIALMMFSISPILGNGSAFFITHSGLNTIYQGYSTHNNYLEILVIQVV